MGEGEDIVQGTLGLFDPEGEYSSNVLEGSFDDKEEYYAQSFNIDQMQNSAIIQKLQEIDENIRWLYILRKVSEYKLSNLYEIVDENPELIDEIASRVDLNIDSGRLSNSLTKPLKLLKHICDKGYKLKAGKIEELGKVFRSDKCELEARDLARNLFLQHTDDEEVKQQILAESLDIFYVGSDIKEGIGLLKSAAEGVDKSVFIEGVKAITEAVNQAISKKEPQLYNEVKSKLKDLVKTGNPIVDFFLGHVQNKIEQFVQDVVTHEQAYEVDYETVDIDPDEKDADVVFQELGEKNNYFDQSNLEVLRLVYDKAQASDELSSSIIQFTESKQVFIAPEADEDGGVEEYKYSEEGRWETIQVSKPIKRYTVSDIKVWAKALTFEQTQDPEFLP